MTKSPKNVYPMSGAYTGHLAIDYLDTFNYSMYHNHSRSLVKCEITNDSDDSWHDIVVTVDGSLLCQRVANIAAVPQRTSVDVTDLVDIDVDKEKLIQLSEGIESDFRVTVSVAGVPAIDIVLPLKLMPYDQWLGVDMRPELLAAFVTPNHPVISRISIAASKYLDKLTGAPDLDEYQSQDTNRVRAQVAAVYEALRAEGLVYASNPPSFERHGQRVRTVEKVLEEKLGTCLDLSLLMASCLESIGINPIVIFIKGHCLVGAWTVRDTYSRAVGDDLEFLLKSASDGINEIVLLESTMITNTQKVSFDEAVQSALQTLKTTSDFLCFVDICRARVSGVRPLPLRVKDQDKWVVQNDGVDHPEATTEVKQYDRYDLTNYASGEVQITKFNLWERKLLDFSLRNNLLNMRVGKRIMPLLSFDIDYLEDCLHRGGSFQVIPWPMESPAQLPHKALYDSSAYSQLKDFVRKEIEYKRLHTFVDEVATKEALKNMFRASRTSLEENGVNNLYLVLGVLKWYETERSQQPRYAPLLLVPVEITRVGYALRLRDEDTMLNITLVQLLLQQYNIDLSALDPLPKDADSDDPARIEAGALGIDVRKVFAVIRDKIRNHRGWNVLDEALIGLFSFNKFVMWHDIHSNAPVLHQNEIISSLVDGRLNVSGIIDTIDAKAADRDTHPGDFITPIDVDSSQLEAVIAAGTGQSFILHGPPGTGKSQTITNIIANALYQGKRVLFVAEKMAALSVVQTRLEKIGLAPFCLELHSNKVTKSHFLSQMESALSVVRHRSPDDFRVAADEVYALRQKLIAYVDAMHAKTPSGLSLYDCITQYASIPGDALDVDIDQMGDVSTHDIEGLHEEVAALDTVFRISGLPSDSPLADLDITDGSAEAERTLKSAVASLISDLGRWATVSQTFKRTFGLDIPPGLEGLQWAVAFVSTVSSLPCFSATVAPLCADTLTFNLVLKAVRAGEGAETSRASLSRAYSDAILRVDPAGLRQQWETACAKWFVPRYFLKRSVLQMMSAYKAGFSEADLRIVLDTLDEVRAQERGYKAGAADIAAAFPEQAVEGAMQWGEMLDTLRGVPEVARLLKQWAMMQGASFKEAVDALSSAYLVPTAPQQWTTALSCASGIERAVADFDRVARVITGVSPHGKPLADIIGDDTAQRLERWHRSLASFRDWYLWCKARHGLHDRHLQCVTDYICGRSHSGAQAAEAMAKGIYRAMAQRIIDADESLRYFNGLLMDDVVKRYRRLTAKLQALSKQELVCRLSANIPSQVMEAHDNSELGFLKRNIKNNGRGTSIRKIIDNIPNLLPKLCPCMLMSPLSVAQYIDLGNDKFDIVIFDEASQMPTSEAVGAIARGKALIVVGDPKQMPPTSFFTTSTVGEDEAYLDDMDSILDDCISLSLPSRYLSWHYRSRHESLIAFSNAQYYGGKLLTFPSIDDQQSKVSFRYIKGVYDKGRSRSNVDEARAIVQEVIKRLGNPDSARHSIGIVSFSKVQQDKIEDLLTDELAKYPELEALAYGSAEPIFIKNLENVQGDERDVILFSVGYGPDASGKLSMNFGPLNNSGGERRLNVAVSRARHEMVVFSSIKAEQIDLRRTNALGVIGLKKFLDYAEVGNNALLSGDVSAMLSADITAAQIARALNDHGLRTRVGVGRSAFKIDVAVVDPADDQNYMLGILLDGPNYFAVKTMRDREVVQPAVLRNLDWNVIRVWSLDWYLRRQDVIDSILRYIEQIKDASAPAPETEPDDAPDVPELTDTRATEAEVVQEPAPAVKYAAAKLNPPATPMTVEDIESSPRNLSSKLQTIIWAEQPIVTSLIYKRVVKAYGLTRATQRLQALVDSALARLDAYSVPNGNNGTTYWRSASDADAFTSYRTDSAREIGDIPYVEIKNAMRYAIDQQVAIDFEALKLLTARLLGFARTGSAIDSALQYVVSLLVDEGYVYISGSKVCKKG